MLNPINELKRVWNWLWSKRGEVAEMDHRDVFMGQIVAEILQSGDHEFRFVPLFATKPIHPVDNRENTIRATKERAEHIEQRKSELLEKRKLSKELLAEFMPSATYIRAIPGESEEYFTFEGNGRVEALKQVFSPEDDIEIEVDVYHPKQREKILKNIEKLREMYGMERNPNLRIHPNDANNF